MGSSKITYFYEAVITGKAPCIIGLFIKRDFMGCFCKESTADELAGALKQTGEWKQGHS